jgi:CO dehydrogenase/acetyl-CoA synthase delta subunit
MQGRGIRRNLGFLDHKKALSQKNLQEFLAEKLNCHMLSVAVSIDDITTRKIKEDLESGMRAVNDFILVAGINIIY